MQQVLVLEQEIGHQVGEKGNIVRTIIINYFTSDF